MCIRDSLAPAGVAVLMRESSFRVVDIVVLCAGLLVHLGLLLVHRALRRDMVVLALSTLSVSLHVATWVLRIVFFNSFFGFGSVDEKLGILLFGLFLILEMGVVAAFLHRQSQLLQEST